MKILDLLKKNENKNLSPINETTAFIELIRGVFSLAFWGALTLGAVVLLIIGLMMIFGQ